MLKNLSAAFTSSGFDSAPYVVVSKEKEFEERHYPARKWVSIAMDGLDREKAVRKGFRYLFNYITGHNDRKTKIEMTTPVTVRPEEGEDRTVISFYIPNEFQDNPPAPKHPDVFIEDRPPLHTFVRQFGGFASNKDWTEEFEKLKNLMSHKVNVSDFQDYTAGYDAPFKIFNRRNEVWLVEESADEVIDLKADE